MFTKLAVRNVRRQMGNYLIYFMTVAFTVALLFAVNNITYSKELQALAKDYDSMSDMLTVETVFVFLIVSFLLSYTTSFMLKLRKREFGTYLTLGMNRRNILTLFLCETLLLCGVALGVGILMGLAIFQCFMALIMKLMEMPVVVSGYSPKGLRLTVILVVSIFFVSSLGSALYLKRVSIYNLIHGEKKTERGVRNPGAWLLLALLALAFLLFHIWGIYEEMKRLLLTNASDTSDLLQKICLLAASLVVLHIAAARGIVGLLLKNKRRKSRGTNTFLWRQLSSSLTANSVLLGIMAALLGFSVICADTSFIDKILEEEALRRDFPYDIMYASSLSGAGYVQNPDAISQEAAEEAIETYADIESCHRYALYTTGESFFYSFTRYAGTGDNLLHDYYMKLSDFNEYIQPLGYEPVTLDDEFFVVVNDREMAKTDWSKARPVLNGKEYHYTAAPYEEYKIFQYIFFFVVVPDEAVLQMHAESDFAFYNLVDGSYDLDSLKKLQQELTYRTTVIDEFAFGAGEEIEKEVCDYSFCEFSRQERLETVAIVVVGAMYLAAIFLLMVMAILALKTLSNLPDDKKRYRLLANLGTGTREQSRTLFRQIFSFFFLPFAVPILLSVPTALIAARLMQMCDFADQVGKIYLIAASVAAVMTLIYVLYFTATYLIAKRNVICSD